MLLLVVIIKSIYAEEVIDSSKKIGFHIQFLIICMGLVFSFAWYLVNRGSTYWVTNYERVIDAIEEYKGISFYNLNLKNDNSFLKKVVR